MKFGEKKLGNNLIEIANINADRQTKGLVRAL